MFPTLLFSCSPRKPLKFMRQLWREIRETEPWPARSDKRWSRRTTMARYTTVVTLLKHFPSFQFSLCPFSFFFLENDCYWCTAIRYLDLSWTVANGAPWQIWRHTECFPNLHGHESKVRHFVCRLILWSTKLDISRWRANSSDKIDNWRGVLSNKRKNVFVLHFAFQSLIMILTGHQLLRGRLEVWAAELSAVRSGRVVPEAEELREVRTGHPCSSWTRKR